MQDRAKNYSYKLENNFGDVSGITDSKLEDTLKMEESQKIEDTPKVDHTPKTDEIPLKPPPSTSEENQNLFTVNVDPCTPLHARNNSQVHCQSYANKKIGAYGFPREGENKEKDQKTVRVRFEDENTKMKQDVEDVPEMMKMRRRNRAQSTKYDLSKAKMFAKLKFNSFLQAPKAGDDNKLDTDRSEQSLETNSFRRGLDGMMSRRNRKSTLFEKSSKASMIAESEQGITQINQYKLMNIIGKGGYSIIRKAYHIEKMKYFAMKIINVTKMKRIMMSKNTTGVDLLENEIDIMKKAKSARIVQLEEVIGDEEEGNVYLALEYVPKGSLDIIKVDEDLSEDKIRKYFRQLVEAIEYLHNNGILHRDIKPGNMLIDDNDDLKLCDFGISEFMKGGSDTLTNTAGTHYFFSPESCKGKPFSGKKADIWAMGVTLYNLLYWKYPFTGEADNTVEEPKFDKMESKRGKASAWANGISTKSLGTLVDLYKDIGEQEISFDEEADPDLLTLLKGILNKDPEQRYTLSDIKSSAWLSKKGSDPIKSVN